MIFSALKEINLQIKTFISFSLIENIQLKSTRIISNEKISIWESCELFFMTDGNHTNFLGYLENKAADEEIVIISIICNSPVELRWHNLVSNSALSPQKHLFVPNLTISISTFLAVPPLNIPFLYSWKLGRRKVNLHGSSNCGKTTSLSLRHFVLLLVRVVPTVAYRKTETLSTEY